MPTTSLRPSNPSVQPTRGNFPQRRVRALACSIFALCGVVITPSTGVAQTWAANPGTNNWNTATNWNPANVPDIAAETATFTTSTRLDPTINGPITISGMVFNGAGAFIVENKDVTAIVGTGLSNTSGLTQTLNNSGLFSDLSFLNSATIGSNIVITNSGFVTFNDNSSAGTGTVTNANSDGLLNFIGNATAGSATLNNAGSGTPNGSSILFSNTANASSSTINNSGTNSNLLFTGTSQGGTAMISNSGAGAFTQFSTDSNAGTATIKNLASGTSIDFTDSASAGGATIISSAAGTTVSFSDTSTGGTSNITLSGDIAIGDFKNNATAGDATITLSNATAFLNFFDTSKGGTSEIRNQASSGTFPSSVVGFFNNSNAQSAAITNSGQNSQTLFSDMSTAGTATIVNSGADSNTQFTVSANAGSASISNTGTGSITGFAQNTNAGSSTIVSSGSFTTVSFIGNSNAGTSNITLSGDIAIGDFKNTATANDATITLTNATALLNFFDTAKAGTSEIRNQGSSGTFPSSVVGFFNNSNAQSAAITNSGQNSQTLFSGTSSAGAAVILNSGADSNTQFIVSARAGTSTISNTGLRSSTGFAQNTNADSATITSSGTQSEVSFIGNSNAGTSTIVLSGTQSLAEFKNSASAANATITNSGASSSTRFSDTAQGGNATLINANPTASIDISGLTSSALTIGSFEGNGSLALGSKTLTAGGNNRDITFSGVIKDGGVSGGTGGGLVKVGTGTWTLSGTNTYTGGTDLRLGTIVVQNPQALGLGNFKLSDGVLRVGGGTKEIRIGGSYTQTGGELQLRIGGTADGQFDRLAVTGGANLGGKLKLDTINGFVPQSGDQIAVVKAGAGVNGTFANVQTAAPLVEGQLQYLPNEVVLSFLRRAFADIAQTPNQFETARALDQGVLAPGAAKLLAFLDTLPLESLPAALDRLAPEELGALFSITRSAANTQAFTVLHRLDEIRAASRDAGLDAVLAGPGKEVKETKEVLSEEGPRGGFYANGNGEFVNVNGTSNARGYDFDSGGVTIGADYKLTRNIVAGVLVNYTRSTADLTRAGRIDADSVRGGVYASVFGAGGYLTAYAGGGYNSYDTKRNGLLGKAKGSPGGAEFNALVAAGYDAHMGALTIGPIATYQYTYTEVDGFRERGSLAPLNIRSQNSQSSRTNVGVRIAYEVPVSGAVLTPEVRATWQHEFGDRSFATTSQFGFGGPDFSVHTPEMGRDSLALSAGLTLQLSPTFGAHAFYLGEFGMSNYDSHNFFVGARVSF